MLWTNNICRTTNFNQYYRHDFPFANTQFKCYWYEWWEIASLKTHKARIHVFCCHLRACWFTAETHTQKERERERAKPFLTHFPNKKNVHRQPNIHKFRMNIASLDFWHFQFFPTTKLTVVIIFASIFDGVCLHLSVFFLYPRAGIFNLTATFFWLYIGLVH